MRSNRYSFLVLQHARSPLSPERLLSRIDEGVKTINERRPLERTAISKLKGLLDLEYIYNSNAIEGNTLTLGETKLVIERGITVNGKPLRDHLEAKNHPEALEYIEKLAGSRNKVDVIELAKIHHLVMSGIDDAVPGEIRDKQVLIAGTRYVPPPPTDVPNLVEFFVDWLDSKPPLHPVELAGVAHAFFVAIHPFHDGNGRVARLLTNLVLIREGYPIAIVREEYRRSYIDALERADYGDPKPIARFFAARVDEILPLYLSAATGLIPLKQAAEELGITQDYAAQLARKRILRAAKLAGRWFVTKEDMEDYKGRRRKRKSRAAG